MVRGPALVAAPEDDDDAGTPVYQEVRGCVKRGGEKVRDGSRSNEVHEEVCICESCLPFHVVSVLSSAWMYR